MNICSSLLMLICICIPEWNHPFSTNDLHCSFWADYNQFNNKPHVAHTWYKKMLSKQEVPGYRYKGLLHLFKRTNNIDQIISLMPSVEKSCKNDTEIQLLFAQSLEEAGLQSAADEKFITLLHTSKDNMQIVLQAAQIFMRRKEPENALLTIKDYLALAQGNPNNFIFHFLAAQAHLMLDRKKEAIEQLELSLNLHPSFDKGWLLLALLNEQTGQLKKAIQGYATYLQLNEKPSPSIQEHLLQLAFEQKLIESKRDQMRVAQSDFDKLMSYFKEHKYKEALKMIDDYVITDDMQFQEVKVHTINRGRPIIMVNGRLSPPDQAIRAYKKSPLLKPLTKWYSRYEDQYAAFQKDGMSFSQNLPSLTANTNLSGQ